MHWISCKDEQPSLNTPRTATPSSALTRALRKRRKWGNKACDRCPWWLNGFTPHSNTPAQTNLFPPESALVIFGRRTSLFHLQKRPLLLWSDVYTDSLFLNLFLSFSFSRHALAKWWIYRSLWLIHSVLLLIFFWPTESALVIVGRRTSFFRLQKRQSLLMEGFLQRQGFFTRHVLAKS
jgi:hypothetical protein